MASADRRERQNDRKRRGWLTINETCKEIGISRSTFYRWLDDPESGLEQIVGRTPLSERVRVPLEALEHLMTRQPRRGRGRRRAPIASNVRPEVPVDEPVPDS